LVVADIGGVEKE